MNEPDNESDPDGPAFAPKAFAAPARLPLPGVAFRPHADDADRWADGWRVADDLECGCDLECVCP